MKYKFDGVNTLWKRILLVVLRCSVSAAPSSPVTAATLAAEEISEAAEKAAVATAPAAFEATEEAAALTAAITAAATAIASSPAAPSATFVTCMKIDITLNIHPYHYTYTLTGQVAKQVFAK